MFLTALITTATVGTVSGTVFYLISKDDKRKFKECLRAYLNHHNLNHSYNFHDQSFIMTPQAFDALTKVRITESDSTISCSLYIALLDDFVPVYNFKYDKTIQRMYDITEEYYVRPHKNKEINALIEEFNLFILTGEWKSKISHWEQTKAKTSEPVKQQTKTDPDIHHHLQEIERKIEWLKNTQTLEIEEMHKIDVLKEDAQQVLKTYQSFREETKIAFKEKIIEALHEISLKLNELSIKKEEQLVSDIDKTISLIKKR